MSETEKQKHISKICRLCLTIKTCLIPISIKENCANVSIATRIMDVVPSIEIKENDTLPMFICTPCRYMLDKAFAFKKKCERTNRKLLKVAQNNSSDWNQRMRNSKDSGENETENSSEVDLAHIIMNEHKYCVNVDENVKNKPTVINTVGEIEKAGNNLEVLQLVQVNIGDNESINTDNVYYLTVNKTLYGEFFLPKQTNMKSDDVKSIVKFVDSKLARQNNYQKMLPFEMKLNVFDDKRPSKVVVKTRNDLSIEVQLEQDAALLLINENNKNMFEPNSNDMKKKPDLSSENKISSSISEDENCSQEASSCVLDEDEKDLSAEDPTGPTTCHLCSKKLANNLMYRRHLKAHFKLSPKCRHCSARFEDRYYLDKHIVHCKSRIMKSMKSRLNIAYQCNMCPKTFVKMSTWERHKSLHQTKVKCCHCDSVFGDKNLFREHQESVHNIKTPTNCSENTNKSNVSSLGNNSPVKIVKKFQGLRFRCSICRKVFINLIALQKHQELEHSYNKNLRSDNKTGGE